ncbi:TlpA disulfide reductase family protein [Catenovulum agarivorans]|uniref:TlpA disulfide reductase family protein n=1 Tax=Catenovulum agarivorans TaxID=1172192 RepID=UPI000557EEA1
MKKIICLLIFLVAPLSAQQAPDFSLKSPTLPKQLSQLKGKVVYVDFWASWCQPCRKSFPWMNQLQQKYSNDEFVMLAVNVDSDIDLAEIFLQQVPANFPIVYDPKGEIAAKFDLLGMPSSFIINKQGEIAYSHTGFFENKIADYQSEIESLLKHSSAAN